MLIPPDEYESDETDHLLDQAIRAVNTEPIPTEPLYRAIETAVGLAAPGVRGESQAPVLERMLNMVRTHRRLSAAAAMVVAAVAVASFLLSPPGRAYALDEIAKAHDRVTSYHVKITPANGLREAWVELNPDGTPRRARADYQTLDDGAKVVILTEGRGDVWFKDKNSHVICPDAEASKEMSELRDIADPKLSFTRLQEAKASGKAQVETQPPARDGEPLVLTATSVKVPDRRSVYEVDPVAKLVQRVVGYRRKGGEWQQVEQRQYFDYNRPIDPQVFRPKMPEDAILVDQISRKPGLVKGNLTDEEIARKAVREFLDALIAGDYDKAGLIYEGIPGDALKQLYDRAGIKVIRTVEVEKPTPEPKNGATAMGVPVKLEVETKGKREVISARPIVRPAHGQPDRWVISGGI